MVMMNRWWLAHVLDKKERVLHQINLLEREIEREQREKTMFETHLLINLYNELERWESILWGEIL